MTNVKAGDLAIVVNAKPRYNGRIVQVLYAAPAHEFTLPNGTVNSAPTEHPSWVLKAVGGPFLAPIGPPRKLVPTWYGVGSDRFLRPLPGDPHDIDVEEKTHP